MQRWLGNSFKKVTCKVNDEELSKALNEIDPSQYVVITESVIGHETVAIAFCPREDWPEVFETFKLYK
jgi:hypothetical protein